MSDTSVYQAYSGNTHLFGGNTPYVEEMYENYLANPGSVPDSWREYFDALQHVPAVDGSNAKDVPHLPVINAFAERAKQGGTKVVMASVDVEMGRKRNAGQTSILSSAQNAPIFLTSILLSMASPMATKKPCLTPATRFLAKIA
jgi:2-oxoglutarate dehydrogenase E1 component